MHVDDRESTKLKEDATTDLTSRLRFGAAEAGHLMWGGARMAVASAWPVLVVAAVIAGVAGWLMPTGAWRWTMVPLVLLLGGF